MTEPAFPFGGPAAETEVVEAPNRGRLVALLIAGFIVVAALAFFVVKPLLTSDTEEAFVAPRAPRRATATPTPSATATPVIPPTFSDVVGRDPFKPLYVAPVIGPPPPATGPPQINPTDGGGNQASTPPSRQFIGNHRVALIRVFSRNGTRYAQTKVDSTVYTPAVGSTFATNYRLLSVDGKCASYLFGDEQFNLCEGQEVLK
ncbi:MAG: hypothetical protein LC640_00720 [Frankia sp.]|nr:hypothetical protein [Frankia sp.]